MPSMNGVTTTKNRPRLPSLAASPLMAHEIAIGVSWNPTPQPTAETCRTVAIHAMRRRRTGSSPELAKCLPVSPASICHFHPKSQVFITKQTTPPPRTIIATDKNESGVFRSKPPPTTPSSNAVLAALRLHFQISTPLAHLHDTWNHQHHSTLRRRHSKAMGLGVLPAAALGPPRTSDVFSEEGRSASRGESTVA